MMLIYLILIVFLVLPAVLLIGCAAAEAYLMKNRPALSWLLPVGTMLASALIQKLMGGGSGLNTLLWSLPAFYGRFSSFGTAAGAVVGAVMRWFAAQS